MANHSDDPVAKFITWENPKNPSIRHVWFDTVDNIIDIINPKKWTWDSYPWTEHESPWAGTKTMDEALHFLRFGWEEVAEAMFLEDAALKVDREIVPEFVIQRDVTGGCVDIGAYISGVPENMINFEQQVRRKKTVSILFNVCSSGSTAAKSIIARGHTVTCICDYLERSGYRVRIDVADTACGRNRNTGNKSHWTLAFCAKDYNQYLDFGRIGFMLGSPSMLRRVFFGVEASSRLWHEDMYSYGCVAPVHPLVGNNYDYIFDYNTPVNHQSANKCLEYIISGKANQVDITGSFYEDYF